MSEYLVVRFEEVIADTVEEAAAIAQRRSREDRAQFFQVLEVRSRVNRGIASSLKSLLHHAATEIVVEPAS